MLIERVRINGFWNKYSLDWELNKDVNILSGVNGSGKSTLLNAIHSILYYGILPPWMENKIKEVDIELSRGYRVICKHEKNKLITTYMQNDQELSKHEDFPLRVDLISLFDYGVSNDLLMDLENCGRIEQFCSKVNELFATSHKKLDEMAIDIRFLLEDGTVIYPDELSAGEKRLLNCLARLLIQDEKEFIVLWDSPEASLSIDHQRSLIRMAREINPYGQLIIATHSPSIIYEGWEKRVVNMEDLLQ